MLAENYAQMLNSMEYCYCQNCKRIKESSELVMTAQGLKCRQCGGYDIDQPGWIACPHQKLTSVKCPRAGKGIIDHENGLECTDRCFFRVRQG
jgi:hypothetical protein